MEKKRKHFHYEEFGRMLEYHTCCNADEGNMNRDMRRDSYKKEHGRIHDAFSTNRPIPEKVDGITLEHGKEDLFSTSAWCL